MQIHLYVLLLVSLHSTPLKLSRDIPYRLCLSTHLSVGFYFGKFYDLSKGDLDRTLIYRTNNEPEYICIRLFCTER